MEVLHKDGYKGSFYIEQNGALLAEMTYVHQGGDRLIMDHTEVADELQGQGTGMLLLDAAVAFARKNNLKMMPLCPYVKHQFEKDPAKYADVAV